MDDSAGLLTLALLNVFLGSDELLHDAFVHRKNLVQIIDYAPIENIHPRLGVLDWHHHRHSGHHRYWRAHEVGVDGRRGNHRTHGEAVMLLDVSHRGYRHTPKIRLSMGVCALCPILAISLLEVLRWKESTLHSCVLKMERGFNCTLMFSGRGS